MTIIHRFGNTELVKKTSENLTILKWSKEMQTDFNSIILEQAHNKLKLLKKDKHICKLYVNNAIALTIVDIMEDSRIQSMTINEKYTMIDKIYHSWHKHLEYVLMFSENLLRLKL